MRNILKLTEFEEDDRVPEESWAVTLLQLAALVVLSTILVVLLILAFALGE